MYPCGWAASSFPRVQFLHPQPPRRGGEGRERGGKYGKAQNRVCVIDWVLLFFPCTYDLSLVLSSCRGSFISFQSFLMSNPYCIIRGTLHHIPSHSQYLVFQFVLFITPPSGVLVYCLGTCVVFRVLCFSSHRVTLSWDSRCIQQCVDEG